MTNTIAVQVRGLGAVLASLKMCWEDFPTEAKSHVTFRTAGYDAISPRRRTLQAAYFTEHCVSWQTIIRFNLRLSDSRYRVLHRCVWLPPYLRRIVGDAPYEPAIV